MVSSHLIRGYSKELKNDIFLMTKDYYWNVVYAVLTFKIFFFLNIWGAILNIFSCCSQLKFFSLFQTDELDPSINHPPSSCSNLYDIYSIVKSWLH